MRHYKHTSIAILLVTLVCVAAAFWQLSRSSEDDVYIAALSPYANSSAVLISGPSTCHVESTSVAGIPPQLVSNFLAANTPSAGSVSLSALNKRFAVANPVELARYTAAGVSSSVLLHGQQNAVHISRVGYDGARSEALFCAEGHEGSLFYLRLENGSWQVVNVVSAWVS